MPKYTVKYTDAQGKRRQVTKDFKIPSIREVIAQELGITDFEYSYPDSSQKNYRVYEVRETRNGPMKVNVIFTIPASYPKQALIKTLKNQKVEFSKVEKYEAPDYWATNNIFKVHTPNGEYLVAVEY